MPISISQPAPRPQSQIVRSEERSSDGNNLAVPTKSFISFDSMPLEGPDQLHLRAAHGYIELGMFEETDGELEEIDPFCLAFAAPDAKRKAIDYACGRFGGGAGEVHVYDDNASTIDLACYEAQMGSLDRAKAHLKRATEIDAKFKLMALQDPDLEPLWASLATDTA